jgi:hypothetical protein
MMCGVMAWKPHTWTQAFPVWNVRNDFIIPAGKNVSKTNRLTHSAELDQHEDMIDP